MSDVLISSEPAIGLALFAGVFTVMAAWEVLAPRREMRLGIGTCGPLIHEKARPVVRDFPLHDPDVAGALGHQCTGRSELARQVFDDTPPRYR